MRLIKRPATTGAVILIIIFETLAFAAIALHSSPPDLWALACAGILAALMLLQFFVLKLTCPGFDRYLLVIANFLVALGMVLQYRLDPNTAFKQMQWFAAGIVGMFAVILFVRKVKKWDRLVYLMMAAGVLLLGASLVLGRVIGGARNWISVAGFSFQPSEFAKVLLIFILAGYFAGKSRPADGGIRRGLSLGDDLPPQVSDLWPVILFVAGAVVLLVIAKDLGAALLFFLTGVTVFFAATSNVWATLLAFIAAGGGSVLAYKIFSHVRVRVQIWLNPWADVEATGYQIVQGLMAIASGGLFGLGLYQGSPKVIPAYHTDFIFAVLCEEFGIIAGLCVIAFFMVLCIRGATIALRAAEPRTALLALGATSMIAYQTFIIIGGVVNMIPLTGITLPFMSYGGSSMLTNLMLIGVLEAAALENTAA